MCFALYSFSFVLCTVSPFVYSCLFPTFLQVYRPLSLGGNPVALNKHHIISYHISSYHIISYHIISYHIISYHISYHIISYHISYHIISYHIVSYHISYHISYHHIIFIIAQMIKVHSVCDFVDSTNGLRFQPNLLYVANLERIDKNC